MVANIKLVSIDVTGIKDSLALTREYTRLLYEGDAKTADSLQREIEAKYARIINAKLVQGKLGQKKVVDYVLNPDSSLLRLLRESAENTNDPVNVEFKASAGGRKGTAIGQITLRDQKKLFVQGDSESFTAQSIKENIFTRRKNIDSSSYLVDLDPVFKKDKSQATVTNRVFNYYFKKDERFKQIVYAKTSTLLLNNLYNINGKKGVRLVGLQIPINQFNPTNIKVTLNKKALEFSINDSFQKYLFRQLDLLYTKELKTTTKPIRKRVGRKGFTRIVEFHPIIEGTQIFGAEVTNSIGLRPSDNVLATIAGSRTANKKSKQRFISGVQWTALVQRRLGQTMEKLGTPNPPMLKERSGRFRTSVQVFPDFKNNLLQYTYNPLYSSLEAYGYTPDLQVETSIREVAQTLYTRAFRIIKV